jgi:hypothetical protein
MMLADAAVLEVMAGAVRHWEAQGGQAESDCLALPSMLLLAAHILPQMVGLQK